jgi:hypothetical protein
MFVSPNYKCAKMYGVPYVYTSSAPLRMMSFDHIGTRQALLYKYSRDTRPFTKKDARNWAVCSYPQLRYSIYRGLGIDLAKYGLDIDTMVSRAGVVHAILSQADDMKLGRYSSYNLDAIFIRFLEHDGWFERYNLDGWCQVDRERVKDIGNEELMILHPENKGVLRSMQKFETNFTQYKPNEYPIGTAPTHRR